MKKPDPKAIAASMGGDDDYKPDDGGSDGTEPESDLEAAVADFCDALDAKDYKSAAEAFRQAVSLASTPGPEESDSGSMGSGLDLTK